jgi:4-amino-4-deoxy-L-arabinose transferase-like glycosyltransferase
VTGGAATPRGATTPDGILCAVDHHTRPFRLGLVLVATIALSLRLLWIARVHPAVDVINDAGYYDHFGSSIESGAGYVMPDGEPTAFWPVGYPATLAAIYRLFGRRPEAAAVFNCLVDTTTTVLIYVLARRWLARRAALLAALVYAVLPGPVTFTSLTLSEPWFTCLLTAALTVLAWADVRLDRRWWPVAFGMLAAAAGYVRGQALPLPLVAAMWFLVAGVGMARALRFGAVALAVVLLATLPWAARNSRVFGEPTFLSTNVGQDFWTGHHEGADGGLAYEDQIAFAALYEHLPRPERERAINRDGLRQGFAYLLSHPEEEVRLSANKLVRLYRDDLDGIRWNEQHGSAPIFTSAERRAMRAVVTAGYWAAIGLGLVGLACGWRRRARWAAFCTLAVAGWTAVHVLFFAEPRFHAPILPLVAVAAGAALASLTSGAWCAASDAVADRAAVEAAGGARTPDRS